MVLPTFEVQPGEERYYCYTLPIPADADFYLERVEQRFSLGAHHMLISTAETQFEEGHGPCSANEFGWNVDFIQAFTANLRFLSGAQTPYFDDPRAELALEPGMAFDVKAGSTVLLQLHWANTTDSVQTAQTAINWWYADGEPTRLLESFFFYHSGIALPPHESTEVAGRCTFPAGTEVVGMVSHMHARGTHFTTHRHDGALQDLVYEEDTWQEPEMKMWPSSDLLTLDNESLEYRCFFTNETDDWIYEGDGAAEEMCMLIGLYSGGDSTIWGFPGQGGLIGNVCSDVP
jgi:hypothetical protein